MKFGKLRRTVALLIILSMTFTMSAGLAFGESSTIGTTGITDVTGAEFAKAKCTITGIDVFGDGEMDVMFEMENNIEADGYVIYRSTSKNGKYSFLDTEIYNDYFDNNVKKGKIYYYKVKGYIEENGRKIYSKFSDPVGKRSTVGPIYAKNLKVTQAGKVTGTIIKNKRADGYYIYYATSKNGPYKLIKKVGKSDLKLNFKVPANKYQYFFKIKGYVTVNGKKYFGKSFGSYEVIADGNKIVNIPEEIKEAIRLEGTVRIKDLVKIDDLIIPDIYGYDEDVVDLTELDYKFKDKDFDFLKYCVNLQSIAFQDCSLDGIQNICKNLKNTKVKYFSFNCVKVDDISPMKELKTLEKAEFYNMDIWDLSALNNLPKLKKVTFSRYSDNVMKEFAVTDYTGLKKTCKNPKAEYEIYNYEEWRELEALMDNFIDKEITPGMSDYEKVKAAHDFVCRTITYTDTSVRVPGCKHLTPYCALVEGHGVCMYYAMAYGYLTARMGFETYYVHGYGSAKLEDHAWNIIKLDGAYYQVDCTWDDPPGGNNIPRYTYFLKSDNTLRSLRDYKWSEKLPICPSDYSN